MLHRPADEHEIPSTEISPAVAVNSDDLTGLEDTLANRKLSVENPQRPFLVDTATYQDLLDSRREVLEDVLAHLGFENGLRGAARRDGSKRARSRLPP